MSDFDFVVLAFFRSAAMVVGRWDLAGTIGADPDSPDPQRDRQRWWNTETTRPHRRWWDTQHSRDERGRS